MVNFIIRNTEVHAKIAIVYENWIAVEGSFVIVILTIRLFFIEAKINSWTDIFSNQIWLAMRYNTLLSDSSASRLFFSKDRCLNRCNISFAISWVEDCLELNFKDIDYQTLAHLSYSSCVCWTSVHATRVQRFLSVRVLISASSFVSMLIVKWPGMFKFQKGYHWDWELRDSESRRQK